MELVVPAMKHLDSYTEALRRGGWSPDNIRADVAVREELEQIEADPEAFVASMDDREAKGPPFTLADGTIVPRLPSYRRWMWDGEMCGSIGFRWQPGTSALPSFALGHIGYVVVPWKRRRGHATRALALMLDNARAEGLANVVLTCDPDNVTSRKVIEANGGVFRERVFGKAWNREELRFEIPL